MNFIAKRTNLIGILLLLSFTAVAAGLYFDVPTRPQKAKPAASTSSEKFVCPMHPDVVSARAGDCPKCGMALVAASKIKAASGGCGHDVEAESACCGKTGTSEMTLPPGHPPVPGFKTSSGCDHGAGMGTNPAK